VLPQVAEPCADVEDQGVGGKLLRWAIWFMSSVLWAKEGGVGATAGERGGSVRKRVTLNCYLLFIPSISNDCDERTLIAQLR